MASKHMKVSCFSLPPGPGSHPHMIGPLEIAANAAATAAILLAGRNSIHTWWTGMLGCALFALLFWQSKLYADVVLQMFFVVSSY